MRNGEGKEGKGEGGEGREGKREGKRGRERLSRIFGK